MTAVEIPKAPECASWCEGHPNAEHGCWEDVHDYGRGVEVAMWCRHRTGLIATGGEGVEVAVLRFAGWSTETGVAEVDRTKVWVGGYEMTPDQAEVLAAAVLEAARLAR